LISARYGPNVLRSFDGGLGRWESGNWRLDAFFVRPVENNLHSFDDRTDSSRKVWSLYGTRASPELGPGSGLDLFYIGYGNKAAEFDQGEGRETRHTLGTRFFGTGGPLKWDLEGHFQFGSFAGGDIAAWSVATGHRTPQRSAPPRPHRPLRGHAGTAFPFATRAQQPARVRRIGMLLGNCEISDVQRAQVDPSTL
jgi:hypothetical protein